MEKIICETSEYRRSRDVMMPKSYLILHASTPAAGRNVTTDVSWACPEYVPLSD